MLPHFPDFKRLEVSDRKDIEQLTLRHPPYSDFDFVNMWSWNLAGGIEICELHGNLVAIFKDYLDGSPVYSFLGDKEVNLTISTLLDYVQKTHNGEAKLSRVPEISLLGIDLERFIIEIELDNCDYVYDLHQFVTYPGNKYYKKRKLANLFLRSYKDIETKILDIKDQNILEAIMSLDDSWIKSKDSGEVAPLLLKEREAMRRFLDLGAENAVCMSLAADGRLVGVILGTLLPSSYAMGLFSKYDKAFLGVNEYLMSAYAKVLVQHNRKYFNTEEDLGLPGLRASKSSYNPVTILRKYTITKT